MQVSDISSDERLSVGEGWSDEVKLRSRLVLKRGWRVVSTYDTETKELRDSCRLHPAVAYTLPIYPKVYVNTEIRATCEVVLDMS